MNNVFYHQNASTFSYVLAAGLIAAQLVHSGHAQQQLEERANALKFRPYSVCGNGDTFTNISNPFTGSYSCLRTDVEQAVSSFYARLLESQEPLEHDFESVLYANLWDLYES